MNAISIQSHERNRNITLLLLIPPSPSQPSLPSLPPSLPLPLLQQRAEELMDAISIQRHKSNRNIALVLLIPLHIPPRQPIQFLCLNLSLLLLCLLPFLPPVLALDLLGADVKADGDGHAFAVVGRTHQRRPVIQEAGDRTLGKEGGREGGMQDLVIKKIMSCLPS